MMSSKRIGPVVVGIALMLTATACGGSDDGPSAEEQFCDAADGLRDNIATLADVDVLTGGLDAVTERFDAIRADVDALQASGLEVAADEIDALQTSVDDLGTVVSSLAESPSLDGASAALTQVSDVVQAAAAVFEVYSTSCE